MTDAFIAFVRHEEELLLLKRTDSDSDSPALWDGIFGIGDSEEDVVSRVSECPGIPVEAGRYVNYTWVDPGEIQNYNCVFSDLDMEDSDKIFRQMYGSVGAYLFIVKTAIGSEKRVADEMQARLMGSGSLSMIADDIFAILHPTGMRGYVMVESNALHQVEKLIGRSGGRDPSARRGLNQTPLKNAKNVLPGEAPVTDILPYLEPKAVTSGIEVGCIVEIVTGAFKGEKARVTLVSDTKEEVSMELYDQPIPMTLKMRGDHVRVLERVE